MPSHALVRRPNATLKLDAWLLSDRVIDFSNQVVFYARCAANSIGKSKEFQRDYERSLSRLAEDLANAAADLDASLLSLRIDGQFDAAAEIAERTRLGTGEAVMTTQAQMQRKGAVA